MLRPSIHKRRSLHLKNMIESAFVFSFMIGTSTYPRKSELESINTGTSVITAFGSIITLDLASCGSNY
jgi:hypothetical protein